MAYAYELQAGRSILKDGKPFATIARHVDEKTSNGPPPVEVDEFAHLCLASQALAEACLTALNLQGSAMRGAVPGLDVDWHFEKIRAALRMIGEDPVDVILRGERAEEGR